MRDIEKIKKFVENQVADCFATGEDISLPEFQSRVSTSAGEFVAFADMMRAFQLLLDSDSPHANVIHKLIDKSDPRDQIFLSGFRY